MPTILCAVRDDDVADLLSYALSRTSQTVRTSRTWSETLAILSQDDITLALLDEALPDAAPGLMAAALQAFTPTVSTIVLAAHDDEASALAYLTAGADDYVPRPFSVPVLVERIRAIIRRRTLARATVEIRDAGLYRTGPVAFDPLHRMVHAGDRAVQLTETQSALLTLLLRYPGRTLPAAMLATQLRRTGNTPSVFALKTHLHLLRARLAELPGQPLRVRTCRGEGYAVDYIAS